MKPREMAARLKELAEGHCTKPKFEEGYTCREYDIGAMYNGEVEACDRCQARDALEDFSQPWRKDYLALHEKLRSVRRIVSEDA